VPGSSKTNEKCTKNENLVIIISVNLHNDVHDWTRIGDLMGIGNALLK
jgi:hypothetical protein